MRTSVVAGLIAMLVVVSAVGVPLTAAAPPESATSSTEQLTAIEITPSAQSADDQIRQTTTLDRTPDRSGEIAAMVSFQLSNRVTEFSTFIPESATVIETDGFDRKNATFYEWDEATDRPSVTFRISADRLSDSEGPLGEEGRYLFTETDEWALVEIPSIGPISLRRTGGQNDELEFVRQTAVDGPGVAGERMAFLGPHEVETHTAHGQTFRLVVPEAADLEAEPADIFASLSSASDSLRVGDRDSELLVIAAPSDSVAWGVRGLQLGDSDMWVQDSEKLDTATNVWVHEYVHTRQEYRTTTETRWFSEASATYYAALLTLEAGEIEFDQFRGVLEEGEATPQSASILSQPDSWENNANYWKGSLVVGDLDRRIRLATDSESSFETVFRSINSHDRTDSRPEDPVTAADFERYVSATGGEEVAAESRRVTTTDATPTMWDGRTHGEVFGQHPAQFSFRLAADDPIRITGLNRSAALNGTSGTLAVGETLTVDMVVENVGGTVGSYELPFEVNGSRRAATGRLRPNETATHQFTHTFTSPGQYTVSVGDRRLDIRVEAPTTPEEASAIDVETPGFGVITAVSALLLLGLLARRP